MACDSNSCSNQYDNFDLALWSPNDEYGDTTGAGQLALSPWRRLKDRSTKRVLIIGPGFGLELNPRQKEVVVQAGYQVHWVVNVPNPEQPGFAVMDFLPLIREAIDGFQPHLVVAGSKGGHYMRALWNQGWWTGPSLMINVHPSLTELPLNVPIVIAVGSNDELYTRSRADLEQLMSTGTPNQCYLHYVGSSGLVNAGQTRIGDK